MKPENKAELKGLIKGVLAAFLAIGIITAIGVVIATVVITDESITIDDNTVLVEGDYTTWTYKGNISLSDGLQSAASLGFQLDDVNNVLTVTYNDNNASHFHRFATYSLTDLSNIFNSPQYQHYTEESSWVEIGVGTQQGNALLWRSALSLSQQTYSMLLRTDYYTVEVWRAGAVVWSYDTNAEEGTSYIECGGISNTGKWILLVGDAGGGSESLMVYEGS